MSRTVAARLPDEVKQALEGKVAPMGFSNLSELIRDVLTRYATDTQEQANRSEACKQQEVGVGDDKSRLLEQSFDNGRCSDCPYRDPVTSREPVLPEVSSSKKDPVAEMIDELFEEQKKS